MPRPASANYKQLGYMNGWAADKAHWPELYRSCLAAGHLHASWSDGRGVTVGWCELCKLMYCIDSSD